MKEKYEALINKETKEEETQTGVSRRMEVGATENKEKGLEGKVESLIRRVEKLERRIPGADVNVNREEEEVL